MEMRRIVMLENEVLRGGETEGKRYMMECCLRGLVEDENQI